MPALSAPQLVTYRKQGHASRWYALPVVPTVVFAAQVNTGGPTTGIVIVPYTAVSEGAFGDVEVGQTLWVGTTPGTNDIARIRIRLAADATNLYVDENANIVWDQNQYLTVVKEWLPWRILPRIVGGVIFKNYNVAYSNQTIQWPPVARMGDPAAKFFDSNPTNVYFSGAASYAVALGATIVGYAWDFDDGTTSTSATPGNHGFTAPGIYWVRLTVTDSNGQTAVTRRPVAIIDPAAVYTVNLQPTSLSSGRDSGWDGSITVFAPTATAEQFPARSPAFLVSRDYYGGVEGSVGFPVGRENVTLFGYIDDDSVVIKPETSEVSFELKSLATVMERSSPFPTYVEDNNSPTTWAQASDLTIFRSLVYLLKFHSTVMEVADVDIYNDATLIKRSDFPEADLWNMFTQYARGTRLLRTGVTRTGTLIVARDPNMLPVVPSTERDAVVEICQLQAGDWIDTVTIPERPYPLTSFICLSGTIYDGDPSHDLTPLFGMSPGHPPLDFGKPRDLPNLELVDQTEANRWAGLALGTDNLPYGDIVIPIAGNWVSAFDAPYNEYLLAPVAGFPSLRGPRLTDARLIITRISVSLDVTTHVMRPTLTCIVTSTQEVGIDGDCFSHDAPDLPIGWGTAPIPPGATVAPIPVVIPPVMTTTRAVWHDHAIFATTEKVYETFDFGGPLTAAPTWTDITGNLPAAIDSFEVDTSGNLMVVSSNLLWRRVTTNVWVADTTPDRWARAACLYQVGDKGGSTAPFCFHDEFACLRWTYLANSNLGPMIGTQVVINNSPGTSLTCAYPPGDALEAKDYYTPINAGNLTVVKNPIYAWGGGIIIPSLIPGHFSPYPSEIFHSFLFRPIDNEVRFDGAVAAFYGTQAPLHFTDTGDNVWAWDGGGAGGLNKNHAVVLAVDSDHRFALNAAYASAVRRYAHNMNEIWYSPDEGVTWTLTDGPLPAVANSNMGIYTLPGEDQRIYACADQFGMEPRIYISGNNGTDWYQKKADASVSNVQSIGLWVDQDS